MAAFHLNLVFDHAGQGSGGEHDVVQRIGEHRRRAPVFLHRSAEPHTRFGGKLLVDQYPLQRRVEFGLGDVGQKTQMARVDAQQEGRFLPDVVRSAQHGAVAAEDDYQIGALDDLLAGQSRFLSRHLGRVQIEMNLEAPLPEPGGETGEIERAFLRSRPCGKCDALNVRRHVMNLPNQSGWQGIPGYVQRQPPPPFMRAPASRRLFFFGEDAASSGRRPEEDSLRRAPSFACSDNA